MTGEQDVRDLARAGDALEVVHRWSQHGDPAKLAWAWAYTEDAITRADLAPAIQASQDSLRGLYARDVPPEIRDGLVEWPLAFLVRGTMQSVCAVPTVSQFIESLSRNREFWALPMWEKVKHTGMSKPDAWKAMKYRASIAWQSFVREHHALAGLRSFGIPVKSHPITDVVLLVDGWYENHTFKVYVENDYFVGRKQESVLTGMTCHHLIAPRQPGNPGVWLVPDTAIEQAVDRIDAASVQ